MKLRVKNDGHLSLSLELGNYLNMKSTGLEKITYWGSDSGCADA